MRIQCSLFLCNFYFQELEIFVIVIYSVVNVGLKWSSLFYNNLVDNKVAAD